MLLFAIKFFEIHHFKNEVTSNILAYLKASSFLNIH